MIDGNLLLLLFKVEFESNLFVSINLLKTC